MMIDLTQLGRMKEKNNPVETVIVYAVMIVLGVLFGYLIVAVCP